MEEMLPQFQRESGHQVRVTYMNVARNTQHVRTGEVADLAIVSPEQWSELQKEGKITGSAPRVIAKVGIGGVVTKGRPKPDIGTVDSFKKTVLSVRTIALSPATTGAPVAAYMVRLFERLGLTDAVKPKLVTTANSTVTIGKGGADIGFAQVSEILADPLIELVAALPAEIQNYTVLTAATPKNAREPEAAKTLIEFLMSGKMTELLAAKGLSRD
jgi:molybdate transport system substrate-binding protein